MSRYTPARRTSAPAIRLELLEDRATPAAVDPPRVLGQVSVAGASDAVRYQDFVYVAGTAGISVFDVAGARLSNPRLLGTVGQRSDLLEVHGNLLVAVRGGLAPNSTRLDTYSVADPASPRFLGTTGEIPYSAAAELTVTDTHAFVVLVNLHLFSGSNDIFDQTGGVLSINITNPSAPVLDGDAVTARGTAAGRDGANDGVLFNVNGTTNDGVNVVAGIDESGGNQNTWSVAQVSPTIIYVTGSSATGTDTQTGSGLVRVVDVSDPRNPRLLRDVQIPGTVQATGISVAGGVAFVTASEGGWNDRAADTSFTGNAVLATLDAADPANPRLVHTQRLATPSRGVGRAQAVSLGGGRFAYGNQGAAATDPGLFVVDVNDANNFQTAGLDVPAEILHMSGGNNLLYAADGSNLIIYQQSAPATQPTISGLAGQSTTAGVPVGPIPFTVGDAETPAADLTVTAASGNTTLIPSAGVVIGGSGAARTVTVTPAPGQTGTATVTLTVRDAAGGTATTAFAVTVNGTGIPTAAVPTLVGYPQFAAGQDAGGSQVIFYNPDKSVRFTADPFPGFAGGVRTAAADFNGDGIADVAVGTGPGGATRLRILDGKDQRVLFGVDPFEAAFTGGVYVAAGDTNGDGRADLIVTPDEGGGPRVDIYSGAGFGKMASFFGIDDPNFRGGARAAVADVSGDGVGDLLVAAGFGGGPRVAGFDGRSLTGTPTRVFGDFFAFEQTLRNGVFITAGDIDGDGKADVIAGGGPGGGPRVYALSGAGLTNGNQLLQLANFFGGVEASRGGIRVTVKDLDGDSKADLVVGAGAGAGSRVTGYLGKTIAASGTPQAAFDYDAVAGFAGGVFVG